MVKNLWQNIKIFCLNHAEPVEMEVTRNINMGSTAFYACTQYFPEKRGENDSPCPNRLNLDDYQGLVLKFLDMINECPPGADMNNLIFDYKGARQKITVRVTKYTPNSIHLGIINRTILPTVKIKMGETS